MLFIPNVLQKPILDIIFLTLCPNEKKKLQSKRFFHDVHIFNFLEKKKLYNLNANSFESCDLVHFNINCVLNIYIKPLLSFSYFVQMKK